MMRAEQSANWVKFLPIATGLLNARPMERIGYLSPSQITSFVDDISVRNALKEAGQKPKKVDTYKEQNASQEDYLKNGKFKIGSYVYLDVKASTFTKSYHLRVRKCIRYKCPFF